MAQQHTNTNLNMGGKASTPVPQFTVPQSLTEVSKQLRDGRHTHDAFVAWAENISKHITQMLDDDQFIYYIHDGSNANNDWKEEDYLHHIRQHVRSIVDHRVPSPPWDFTRELGRGSYGSVLCDKASLCEHVWKLQFRDISPKRMEFMKWKQETNKELLAMVWQEIHVSEALSRHKLSFQIQEVHFVEGSYTAMKMPRMIMDVATFAYTAACMADNAPDMQATSLSPEALDEALLAVMMRAFEKLWRAWFEGGIFVGDYSPSNCMIGWDAAIKKWDVVLIDNGGSWLQTDVITDKEPKTVMGLLQMDTSQFARQVRNITTFVFSGLSDEYTYSAIKDPQHRAWLFMAAQSLYRFAYVFYAKPAARAVVSAVTHSCKTHTPSHPDTCHLFQNAMLTDHVQQTLQKILAFETKNEMYMTAEGNLKPTPQPQAQSGMPKWMMLRPGNVPVTDAEGVHDAILHGTMKPFVRFRMEETEQAISKPADGSASKESAQDLYETTYAEFFAAKRSTMQERHPYPCKERPQGFASDIAV